MIKEEESPLRAIFGDTPRVRIIETLVSHPAFDYELSDLAAIAGVREMRTIVLQKTILMDYQIMKEVRVDDNTKRYSFNRDSPTGKLLNSFVFKLAEIGIKLQEEGREHGKKN
jgi:hypothetical protein